MKKSDTQLGKPTTLYKGTTAELAALSAVEGMQAYDTTLDKFVYYDGSNWAEVSGTDDDAIHDNVSGEIAAITEKTSLADNDLVLIEDSVASNAKKKSKISTFLAKARSILFLNEITTPSTPAAGQVSLYVKDGGLPFVKNDLGVESPIALGGVWKDWTPTVSASGSMTFTVTTINYARYMRIGDTCFHEVSIRGNTGGTPATALTITMPFSISGDLFYAGVLYTPATGIKGAFGSISSGNITTFRYYGLTSIPIENGVSIRFSGFFKIA